MLRSWKTLRFGLLLMLVTPVMSGCWPKPADGQCSELPCPSGLTVRQGTVLRLDGGWEIGLQMVYCGRYTDAAGQRHTGLVARLSVWDGQAPRAETLTVHEGAVFDAGGRYRVVKIQTARPAWLPGTADGAVTILLVP